MKKYLKKLDAFINQLEKISPLSNIVFEKEPGLLPDNWVDLKEQFSVSISEDVKLFYKEINGFTLSWEYHSDELEKQNLFIEGFARILSFSEMMAGFDGRLWRNELWDDKTPGADQVFYKRLKVFDYFGKDNVHCVCLELSTENLLTNKLWIFRQGNKPVPMSINIDEYIDKLCFTKGFWGWQYLYTDDAFSLKDLEGVQTDIDLALNNYSKIFPENVYNELTELYHKKQK